MTTPFSAEAALAGLKDFQRRTVDYAFDRLFRSANASRRFLVADEVGLGKTMVAKGVIARTLEHLAGLGRRVDVIYVCSNADIAAQNIGRLMIPGQRAFARATRLTLLPLETENLRAHSVNFISFTPGTTFHQGNRTGRKDERRLIYQMLRSLPEIDNRGLLNALRGSAEGERWRSDAQIPLHYDQEIAERFRQAVVADSTLLANVTEVTSAYRDRRKSPGPADVERCLAMIGALRHRLAKACLSSLEPDLVILDEFQRFSDLLDDPERNPSAELAHDLFNYSDQLRVLLLSATPYKWFSRDDDGEDHYPDFLRTIRFLLGGRSEKLIDLQADIRAFRNGMLAARSEDDFVALTQPKARIEAVLTGIMCRTERVGSTSGGDAMVRESVLLPRLRPEDLQEFKALDILASRVDDAEPIEYWKSCPYLLNFMKEYELKRRVKDDAAKAGSAIGDLLGVGGVNLLSQSDIDRFRRIEAGNPRLRALMDDIEHQGLWSILWLQPSMPYWAPRGGYVKAAKASKQLIFSAWNVIPDALAALLSYEAERRLIDGGAGRPRYTNVAKRFAPRLRFSGQSDGRLRGMSAMPLMFPSRVLASKVTPLLMASGAESVPFELVRSQAIALLGPLIEGVVDRAVDDGPPDRRWYWVTIARLEHASHPESTAWCLSRWGAARSSLDEDETDRSTGFQAHAAHWVEAATGADLGLGRVPADLVEVVADIALAAPAVCALRTMTRLLAPMALVPEALMNASVRIAEGIRSQFNSPRAIALLQSTEDDDSYWQKVLQYSVDGNLQALLDEYAHVLHDPRMALQAGLDSDAAAIAGAMHEAMTLRSATLRPDEVSLVDGRLKVEPVPAGLRTHFALRFGEQDDEAGAVSRKEAVQAAFNSPFWPFVLVSTSVGQEGLDFHTWCHSVIHWNLPSNPVDLEQREGRVHRYKGHAVRKNVATQYGLDAIERAKVTGRDAWEAVFDLAVQGRQDSLNDLVPYWIFECEGGAFIQRRVVALPLSRDEARYQALRRSLALYRMVFAQPRQQDLLACLEQTLGAEQAAVTSKQWRIQLAPPVAS